MTGNTIVKTGVITVLALSVATPAMAGNGVKSVSLKRHGIDVAPIEVNANRNGYTSVKTSSHKFLLKLSASAKKGKRLVAGQIGAYNGSDYFEAPSSKYWEKKIKPKVFNGGKQKISFSYTPTIPVSKVSWTGGNPVEVCQKHMNKNAKSASARKAFLKKTHSVSAMAIFQLHAVAAKKKAAKKKKWTFAKSTSKKTSYIYTVNVTCLPVKKSAGLG